MTIRHVVPSRYQALLFTLAGVLLTAAVFASIGEIPAMTTDLAVLAAAAHDRIMAEVVEPLERAAEAERVERHRSYAVVARLKASMLRLGLPRRCAT